MRSLGKAKSRLADLLRNAGAGEFQIKFTQDPASVPSSELRESGTTASDHDGQWLIDLGARSQTDILLPTRGDDRSPLA